VSDANAAAEAFFASSRNPQRLSAQLPVVPFVAPTWAQDLPRLRAYVDETGDRGMRDTASPIFGMAGVIVNEPGEAAARAALRGLRAEFGTPAGRPLSWKNDLKDHDRRVHAASVLSKVMGLRVIYVAVEKRELWAGTYGESPLLMYNVIAYETLKRILWAAAHSRRGKHQVEVRFGHVRDHDHTDTHRYFQIKQGDRGVPFDVMTKLEWVGAQQYEMSQVADLYAGFLKAAVWPNKYGDIEGRYLTTVWSQIRNSEQCVISLGLQYRPRSELIKAKPWWPCRDCPSQY